MKTPTLNALVWQEGKYFVAKALEVEVASQGLSKKEALDNLSEALSLYFEDENPSRISIPNIGRVEVDKVHLKNLSYA